MNLLLSKHADVIPQVSMFLELSTQYKGLLLNNRSILRKECHPTKSSLYFWNFTEVMHITLYNFLIYFLEGKDLTFPLWPMACHSNDILSGR